jgi:transposase
MKIKVNQFTDEFRLRVVQEYLNTEVSQAELNAKYGIKSKNSITNWMRKFGMKAPNQQQIELQCAMAKQTEKTAYERELEGKVQKLEQKLEHERLRTLALNTMIDIAERDLKISIRKKSGAKQ